MWQTLEYHLSTLYLVAKIVVVVVVVKYFWVLLWLTLICRIALYMYLYLYFYMYLHFVPWVDLDLQASLRLGLCASWPPGLLTVEDMSVRFDIWS